MRPGDAASLARYVVQRAPHYGLDPNAVIAVSIQEGISGKIGDNGTSFGPWMLHKGGEYPAGAPQDPVAANAWAWSKPGIDYALGRMSRVASGQQGRQAVHSIVYRFERPRNPGAEYTAAVRALPASDGGPADNSGGVVSILKGIVGTVLPPGAPNPVSVGQGAYDAAKSAYDTAQAIAAFLGKLTDPHFWLRGLEIVGGGILVMLGVYLLARNVGLAQPVQDAAENFVPGAPELKTIEATAGPEAAVEEGAAVAA